ncbi:hypothetical protein [Paenibacillus algorifonticola]|uniref:hypothetical protein n=1 Tax=Paenibacillus algorifonticola TaxID=684063 RepID=UPI0011607E4E|nr:hypothetical protein [Paenibacillus algorifonticola]
MFKITVSQSERHLFSSGWIEGFDYLFHANGDSDGVATCLLNFSDIYAPENVSVKKKAPIEISYECGDLSFGMFELLANQPLQIKQGASKWFSANFLVYQEVDSLQMWILKTWSEGCSDISWRNFPSARQKLSWLSACSS